MAFPRPQCTYPTGERLHRFLQGRLENQAMWLEVAGKPDGEIRLPCSSLDLEALGLERNEEGDFLFKGHSVRASW